MPDYGIRDRVALVTGANRREGIGAATALALASAGAMVAITYHRPDEDLPADPGIPGRDHYESTRSEDPAWLVDSIESGGGSAFALEADLGDLASPRTIFDACEAELGRVEILVNNATHCTGDTFLPPDAVTPANPVMDDIASFTAEGYDDHVAVNDRATGLMMSEFVARHVRDGAGWGRIVNFSSDGTPVFPTQVSYGATKYAIEAMSKSAAVELAPLGITVNIVSPGPIQTGYIPPEAEAEVTAMIPLGRLGRPDDVADVVAFFCSDQARWLTGQILYAGGGKRIL